ncbi:MAG: aspartate-alanine antiporter [Candidatus Saganbacteria bacterium]|nr:aspartate-alanine antiporter [Candidatus Saganbacteria bacterium]
MLDSIIELCRSYPQIVIFLAIAIGYFVGKVKIFGFNLGSTAGVLLAALVLGQMNIAVTPLLKNVGFALFIFAIGYKVGPQFFGGLKKEGIHYILLSVVVAITGLVTAIILGKLFAFDRGTVAGLLSGAMTQSSAIGTAEGAINHLPITAQAKAILDGNVAIAYAITYIFGTAGLIVFFKLIPRIMGINLKAEAKKLEEEMSGGSAEMSPELFSWSKRLNLRAYRVTKTPLPNNIVIDRIKRNGKVIDPMPDTVIQQGDTVTVVGDRSQLMKLTETIGPEIDDKEAVDLIGEIIGICVLNKDAVGKTLGEISSLHGHGCFLRKISRQQHELPLTKNTVLHKCDILQVAGSKKDVEKFVNYLGYAERPTSTTDLITVGWGCVLGILLGLIAIPVAGIPITLGVGGGILVSGLIFGWLRSVHPTFGQIPSGAQWIFTDLGLNLFIASVGLSAGPRALQALQSTGVNIFFAGVILTLTPMIIGLLFGKFILKLNPVLLLGALTGAGTVTAALNALKEEADSSAPALGYTVPYAFGNVILTVWGTILVNIM